MPDRPEILFRSRSARQTLIVERQAGELRLLILSDQSNEWQSRLDPADPIRLVAPYMQAMMLALLFRPEPARVHVLGLGGGRIPVFLRHLYPDLWIDCTEIDPQIPLLAARFFGFRPDARMRIVIGDGREVLASSPPGQYDIIFVDGFCGIGSAPLRLSSREFFGICRARLAPGGVIAVNVVPGGGLVPERLRTIEDAFPAGYLHQGDGTMAVFASEGPRVALEELMRRASALQERRPRGLSFPEMARSLGAIPEVDAEPITDGTSPEAVAIPRELLGSIRADDPCPCGSGRGFAECHGRRKDLNSRENPP